MVAIAILIAIGILFAALYWIPYMLWFTKFGCDWWLIFRPVITGVTSGVSPFANSLYYSPPWLLIFLVPFALLPPPLDMAALVTVSVTTIIFTLLKMKASPLVIILFLLTPNLWWGIFVGNVDFLVMLGFILPPQIGLIFVLLKPQIGAAVALFWAIEAWRRNGIREVVRVLAPVAMLIVLSFVIFGWWFAHMGDATKKYWNIANWPYLLPFGLVLLLKAIREHKQGLSITAGLFLSPYIHTQTLPLAVMGLLPNELETIVSILALWFVWFVRGVM
jgi:hypothetical protein